MVHVYRTHGRARMAHLNETDHHIRSCGMYGSMNSYDIGWADGFLLY